MEYLSNPHAWLFALLIFVLRVGDMTLDTIRVLFVVRGKNKACQAFPVLRYLLVHLALKDRLSFYLLCG